MMEYPCPIYIQKLSLLTEVLSTALFSVFVTLKRTRARSVSIIDSLRGSLVSFVCFCAPKKRVRAYTRA